MNIPGQLSAGDSITWQDDAAHDNLGNVLSSDVWTLHYYLRAGTQALNLTGVANGPGWKTSIASADSAPLTPGVFYWQASVSNGSQRITLGTGTIKIIADLAFSGSPADFDGRSDNEKALDAINAEISARLNGGTAEEYTIGNRSLKKTPMKDLIAMQSRYNTIVQRERQAQKIAQGLGNPRQMYVRF
jgi:hypothetical protein